MLSDKSLEPTQLPSLYLYSKSAKADFDESIKYYIMCKMLCNNYLHTYCNERWTPMLVTPAVHRFIVE